MDIGYLQLVNRTWNGHHLQSVINWEVWKNCAWKNCAWKNCAVEELCMEELCVEELCMEELWHSHLLIDWFHVILINKEFILYFFTSIFWVGMIANPVDSNLFWQLATRIEKNLKKLSRYMCQIYSSDVLIRIQISVYQGVGSLIQWYISIAKCLLYLEHLLNF